MRRRTLIRRTGALAAVGLAGCVSDEPTDDEADGANPAGASPDGDGGDGEASMQVTDRAIETLAADCSSGGDTTAVDVADGVVTITGTISASNPCHEAKLANVTKVSGMSEDGGTGLEVDVTTESTDGVCVECVGAIEYEATIEFSGEAPVDVRVLHDGEELDSGITDGGSDSGSESDGSRSIDDSRLAVTDRRSGQAVDEVDISFDTDAETVELTGTIHGSDGCQTAALGDVSYDAGADRLSVDVVTQSDGSGEVCTGGIVEIDYEATISFSGGVPTEATVAHDGQGIAGAAHGSSSASATPPDES